MCTHCVHTVGTSLRKCLRKPEMCLFINISWSEKSWEEKITWEPLVLEVYKGALKIYTIFISIFIYNRSRITYLIRIYVRGLVVF